MTSNVNRVSLGQCEKGSFSRRTLLGATGVLAASAALPAVVRGGAPGAKRYRAAVIGHTGHGDYGHGLDVVWADVPGVDLVAVADADPKG